MWSIRTCVCNSICWPDYSRGLILCSMLCVHMLHIDRSIWRAEPYYACIKADLSNNQAWWAGLAGGKALVGGRTSVRYRFGSPFSSKRLWFVDTVLWLCPSLPTETLKWLSSLPILMQESFWWWQCIDRYIISLFPPPPHPYPLPTHPLLPVPNKPYGFCGR